MMGLGKRICFYIWPFLVPMYIYSNIYVKFLEISGVYHFSIITGKFSLLHDEDDGGDEHDEFEDDGVGVVVW